MPRTLCRPLAAALFGAILSGSPAIAQQPSADKIIQALQAQRNAADDRAALVTARVLQLEEEIARLKAELAALKGGAKK